MREAFKEHRFGADALARIATINDVVRTYQAEGYRLTLRQLYYQLVTVNAIVNEERSYKNLGELLGQARLAGLVDWNAIEDRQRVPRMHIEFDDIVQRVDVALDNYRLRRWADQPYYVELWVEKEALAGVLEPIANEHHVVLMVNKGYSSLSAMKESADRFIEGTKQQTPAERMGVLLYLGDHDPSGEDMVRDVRDRLSLLGVYPRNLEVRKIALTTAQVQRYKPPHNPAKTTDSRYEAYRRLHGDRCWEVDALPPRVLTQLINDEIAGLCSEARMDAVKAQEEKDKTDLRGAVAGLLKQRRRAQKKGTDR
jgi:hypothetical protein